MGWSLFRRVLLLGLLFAPGALAAGPGDDLLKLVPADSGVTVVVEDLRGHARGISDSPLFKSIEGLPAVKNWLASEGFRRFERGSRDVAATLGLSIETFRDDLFGDAFILAFQPGPALRPDLGRGLLLVRPRDQAMIPRLLNALNAAQTKSGELVAVEERPRGPLSYKVRKYKSPRRPTEFYIQLDDGSLAWSNSEPMIQGVIDRKLTHGPGLGDDASFQRVRRGLADRPFISLFLNPRFIERLVADNSRPSKPTQDRQTAMLARYIGAIGQVGLCLEWRDGFVLHSHEVLVTEKLDPWLKRWLTRPAAPVVLPASLPPSTVAVLSANLDFEALRDAAWELTAEEDRPSLENYKLALQGLLLGRDPLTEILPRLGPGALLYLEIDPDQPLKNRFPMVGVVGWSDLPGAEDLAAPLDNALRTILAISALERKQRAANARVESRTVGDSRLTLLTEGPKTLGPLPIEWIATGFSSSAARREAVARFGSGQAPAVFSRLRSQYFPEAETFAIVDLPRLVNEVRAPEGNWPGFSRPDPRGQSPRPNRISTN